MSQGQQLQKKKVYASKNNKNSSFISFGKSKIRWSLQLAQCVNLFWVVVVLRTSRLKNCCKVLADRRAKIFAQCASSTYCLKHNFYCKRSFKSMKIVVESMNIIKGTKIVQKLNSANFTSVIFFKYCFFWWRLENCERICGRPEIFVDSPRQANEKKSKGKPLPTWTV